MVDTDPHTVDDDTVELVLGSVRGKCSKRPHSLIKNDEFCQSARKYVRENACVRGEPNLTSEMFRRWIKTEHNCDVSGETARKWLHTLGFKQVTHTKGVYFDGHEREDVVAYRKTFVEKLSNLDRRCIYSGHEPILYPNEKPLIIVHHDESTFYANADQSCYWADDSVTILKQKSLGQSIMVSDFIEECSNDYLEYDGEQARLLLETQTEGYFDSTKFLKQVSKAIDIFERKYPHAQGVFIFDNAPSHKKCSEDSLNVNRMNVGPGGKQPVMKDTVHNGVVQHMVDGSGIPKGMKLVLEERGIDTSGMNARKMREVLGAHSDFLNVTTLVEELVESRNHIPLFFPKFHCELNAIERCWCHAKKYSRQYVNGSIVRLRKVIPEALATCKPDLISKFFEGVKFYLAAYENGCNCLNVDSQVKVYKSHRRVSSILPTSPD